MDMMFSDALFTFAVLYLAIAFVCAVVGFVVRYRSSENWPNERWAERKE